VCALERKPRKEFVSFKQGEQEQIKSKGSLQEKERKILAFFEIVILTSLERKMTRNGERGSSGETGKRGGGGEN